MAKTKDVQTDAWGIDHRYQDAHAEWHEVPRDTIDALKSAMGTGEPDDSDTVMVVRVGTTTRIPRAAELALESGEKRKVKAVLPPDLPPGYHELRFHDGRTVRLI